MNVNKKKQNTNKTAGGQKLGVGTDRQSLRGRKENLQGTVSTPCIAVPRGFKRREGRCVAVPRRRLDRHLTVCTLQGDEPESSSEDGVGMEEEDWEGKEKRGKEERRKRTPKGEEERICKGDKRSGDRKSEQMEFSGKRVERVG